MSNSQDFLTLVYTFLIMPELPEVEVIKNELKEKIVGLTFSDLKIKVPKLFQRNGHTEKDLVGAKIKDIRRRAKLIIFDLSNGISLVMHLKLTGQLIYEDKNTRVAGGHPIPPLNQPVPNKTTHLIFSFTNEGKLYFNDLRKFGFVKVVPTAQVERLKMIAEFGPEPFDPTFTADVFAQRLKKHSSQKIKPLLMDQKFLSGVGNIYGDEALWLAKIHPLKQAGDLRADEIKNLYQGLKDSLASAIKLGGSSHQAFLRSGGEAGLYLNFAHAYHRDGEPCDRCGTIMKRIKIGSRGAHYCPKCQKLA